MASYLDPSSWKKRSNVGAFAKDLVRTLRPGHEADPYGDVEDSRLWNAGMHPDQIAQGTAQSDEAYRQAQMANMSEDNQLNRDQYEEEKNLRLQRLQRVAEYQKNNEGFPLAGLDPSMVTDKSIAEHEGGRLGREMKASTSLGQYENVSTSIANAVAKIDEGSEWTEGGLAGATDWIPGSPQYELDASIDEVLANLGFSELQKMRDASPTGGALGQVAVRELEMLQSTVANLQKPGLSNEEKRRNMKKIQEHYNNWLDITMQGVGRNTDDVNMHSIGDLPLATPEATSGWSIERD